MEVVVTPLTVEIVDAVLVNVLPGGGFGVAAGVLLVVVVVYEYTGIEYWVLA